MTNFKFKFKIWTNQSATPHYRWVTLAADGTALGRATWHLSRPRRYRLPRLQYRRHRSARAVGTALGRATWHLSRPRRYRPSGGR
jgi:hypothetical protein